MLQQLIYNSMVKCADMSNDVQQQQQPPAQSHTIRNLALGAAAVGAGVFGAHKLGVKLPNLKGTGAVAKVEESLGAATPLYGAAHTPTAAHQSYDAITNIQGHSHNPSAELATHVPEKGFRHEDYLHNDSSKPEHSQEAIHGILAHNNAHPNDVIPGYKQQPVANSVKPSNNTPPVPSESKPANVQSTSTTSKPDSKLNNAVHTPAAETLHTQAPSEPKPDAKLDSKQPTTPVAEATPAIKSMVQNSAERMPSQVTNGVANNAPKEINNGQKKPFDYKQTAERYRQGDTYKADPEKGEARISYRTTIGHPGIAHDDIHFTTNTPAQKGDKFKHEDYLHNDPNKTEHSPEAIQGILDHNEAHPKYPIRPK